MFTLTIDGAPATGCVFPVVDPATEERFADAPSCSQAQLDDAMCAAKRAFPNWAEDETMRRAVLLIGADAIEADIDRLAEVLTREQGKPLRDARWEVKVTADTFRYFATLETDTVRLRDDSAALVQVVRRPIGVVAAITAWNFPLALAARKVAPALLAGNTVVLKPSPFTPLATLALGSLLAELMPPGVLNVLSGGDDLGALMISHPVPEKITFTGSTATGRRIAAAAGSDLKRLTLELGGNDPAIVLDDADVALVAPAIFKSAFVNNGQVCSAIKRVYAPASLADELTEALVALARSLRVGRGLCDDVDVGPLNNAPQFDRIRGLVDEARHQGATIATGGQRCLEPGYFYEPTIVTGVTDGLALVDEEQFGPVLPVVLYRDLPDAIARANASKFGLDASLWGTDLDRIADVAPRLECGTVWMNTHGVRDLDQPTGGHKWSGIGVENGPWGYEDLTNLQVLYRARA